MAEFLVREQLSEAASSLPGNERSQLIAEPCVGIVPSVRLPGDTQQLQSPLLLPATKIRGVSHVEL